jgi:hypothetical protein
MIAAAVCCSEKTLARLASVARKNVTACRKSYGSAPPARRSISIGLASFSGALSTFASRNNRLVCLCRGYVIQDRMQNKPLMLVLDVDLVAHPALHFGQ